MKKLRIFIIIFAVLAGITGYWYYQKNIYSKEVLKLEILGPAEAQLLEEVEYAVKYKNNGDFNLEDAKLTFECPKNSLECAVLGKEELTEEKKSLRKEFSLLTIYPGEEKTFRIKVRLLGKENEIRQAKAALSYRPKNLKAYYESTTTFTTIIKSVSLTFELDLPSKIESGKEIKLKLNYYSTLNYPLPNLRIKINYPEGFEFLSSKPRALEKTEWEIGILNRGEGGRIEILGVLRGEPGQLKIFEAEVGSWQEGEFLSLKKTFRGVEIIKPFFYIFQEINKNPKYIGNPGELLNYEIFFKNTGKDIAENLFLTVNLEGEAFDFESIRVELGKFDKEERKIFWDYVKVSELKKLLPMEEGKVEFWIKIKDEFLPETKNPMVKNIVSLDGLREEFETKINSQLEISQKGFFEDEIFGNSGPFPPQVGQTTTYTIVWEVKNFYNNLKNAKVKTILPPEVQLTGKISPQEESSKFAFDSQSREIIWEIGDLAAGTGVSISTKSLAFQIAFSPKNLEKTPEIVSQAQITGEDQFTGQILQNIAPAIDALLAPSLSIEMQE